MIRDENPFSLIYGLPFPSPANLLKNQQSRWITSFNISNTLNVQASKNESLLVDVESLHINLLYDYGFKENWMLRVQLPYVIYSGGFLDSAIDTYHQALSLPEADRPDFQTDQININATLNNQVAININQQQKNLGDISLQLAWQNYRLAQMSLSYWVSLKLPTGDANKLTGSGKTDISAWASMDYQLTKSRWLYGQGGLLFMDGSKVLKNIQNDWAVFATSGIKFQPWKQIELKTQLDFHSALYDSELKFLSQVIQLTFGGNYIPNPNHDISLSVTEDIKSGASPDVIFNISWSIKLF